MKARMHRKFARAITVAASAALVAGCGVVTGHRSFGYSAKTPETPSAGAEIGTSSGSVPSDTVDPCTLPISNPRWRDHGGEQAYETRCGHPPPH
jgi:hypothetical protein